MFYGACLKNHWCFMHTLIQLRISALKLNFKFFFADIHCQLIHTPMNPEQFLSLVCPTHLWIGDNISFHSIFFSFTRPECLFCASGFQFIHSSGKICQKQLLLWVSGHLYSIKYTFEFSDRITIYTFWFMNLFILYLIGFFLMHQFSMVYLIYLIHGMCMFTSDS